MRSRAFSEDAEPPLLDPKKPAIATPNTPTIASASNNVMATERRVFFIELLTVLFVGGNRLMIAGGIREPFNEYGRLTIWVLLTDLTERSPHTVDIYYALKT